MAGNLDTCWTLVRDAAGGDGDACSLFAHSYLGIVRAFLVKRWRGSTTFDHLDDAVQEVFLDLFRADGALARLDPERAPSFRSFLFGVVHKVALRYEERMAKHRDRAAHDQPEPDETPGPDESMSRAFDRAWAQRIVQLARERQQELADGKDDAARRRVELLQLRFGEGLPIRTIAARWKADPTHLHREYAKAREEFKEALRVVVRHYHTGPAGEIERECRSLLALLE